MKFLRTLLATAVLGTTPVWAHSFSTQQTKDIEKIVEQYLLNNPNILVRVSEKLRNQAESERDTMMADAVFNNPDLPVLGNPNGTVVLAEFIDYQCGFCKRQHPIILKALKDNPDVKLVILDFPALGAVSEYGARAVLAAKIQGKYDVLHHALVEHRGRLSIKKIDEIAQSVGVNVATMKRDMNGDAIVATVRKTLQIARALGVDGTPALIGQGVAEPRVGLQSAERLDSLITQVRANIGKGSQ